nr:hypothetical protein [Tanacetum cinerariifolium]
LEINIEDIGALLIWVEKRERQDQGGEIRSGSKFRRLERVPAGYNRVTVGFLPDALGRISTKLCEVYECVGADWVREDAG